MAKRTMVEVEALTRVKDDGTQHAAGEKFMMEQSLVQPHVDAGVVKEVGKTPADKQAKAAATK